MFFGLVSCHIKVWLSELRKKWEKMGKLRVDTVMTVKSVKIF